jgi:hypothetical protein
MGLLELRKNWILGGYSSTFVSSSELSDVGLCDLVDGCLRTLLPVVCPENGKTELLDFKGRNQLDEILPGLPAAHKDELFRIGGECAVEQEKEGFAWDHFDLCCYSPFARFEGTHHIVHSIEIKRTGAIPAWLPPRLLGSAAPIKLRYFRFGLEHFQSRRTFASLGYTPQITESLLLDCCSNTLSIRMTVESDSRKVENPFERVPQLRIFAEVLHQSAGIDVQTEYMRDLRENW